MNMPRMERAPRKDEEQSGSDGVVPCGPALRPGAGRGALITEGAQSAQAQEIMRNGGSLPF